MTGENFGQSVHHRPEVQILRGPSLDVVWCRSGLQTEGFVTGFSKLRQSIALCGLLAAAFVGDTINPSAFGGTSTLKWLLTRA